MHRVTEAEAVAMLEEMGAVLTGHFIGSSGKHLSAYVSKEVPTRYPQVLRHLAGGLAKLTMHYQVDVVVAPPMGALSFGTMVAEELESEDAYLEAIDPSDSDSELEVRRLPFQEAVISRRVGIVEDIIVTGETSGRSIRAVQNAGGNVVWLGCMWNRSDSTAKSLGIPVLCALVSRRLEDFTLEECEDHGLCFRRVPIRLKPGHGAQFRKENPGYPGGYV